VAPQREKKRKRKRKRDEQHPQTRRGTRRKRPPRASEEAPEKKKKKRGVTATRGALRCHHSRSPLTQQRKVEKTVKKVKREREIGGDET